MTYARNASSFDPYGGLTEEEMGTQGPYWLRHWRGQLSLVRSYWVNGALVNIVLSISQAMLLAAAQSRNLFLIAWAFLAFVAFSIVLRVWSFVGIWRSAGRHPERGGSQTWAWVARAVMVLGAFILIAQSPRLWLQVREMALIATGNDPLGAPASISVSPDGRTLTLDGVIISGLGNVLSQRISSAPKVQTVVLNSHGGRIVEALAVADIIRAKRLNTRVDRDCESACTLLFLAGAERSASPLSAIGFHQPDFPGVVDSERRTMIDENRQDYREAGVNDAFIDRIMATPPEKMWYPTHEEMVEAGAINAIDVSNRPAAGQADRLSQLLRQGASNLNANKGKMLDDMTRLDSATVDGETLKIRYTITRPIAVSRAEFVRRMTPMLRKQVCNVQDADLIKAGARYTMNYESRDGRMLGEVLVDRC